MSNRQRVVVVTGGGGGIGAAIAESLARAGDFVVTMDPLVSVDGSQSLPEPAETTAGRIVAAGGAARASSVSVTDEAGVRELFGQLADEFGGLDAVVNVAGITRPTSFCTGSDEDWLGVLSVHLDGYRNVLGAALPLMAAAGHGHILGVTSGSGWRSANAGAYGCAKRAVAALTWELGRHAPAGVVVNAISPIAATRMVTAALSRGSQTSTSATGGLSLGSMPAPEDLGPLGAHLVGSEFNACQGQVIFAGGSEIAVIDPPRLLEAVRQDETAGIFETATSIALAPAEKKQRTAGGSNARFGTSLDNHPPAQPATVTRSCAVVTDQPAVAKAMCAALIDRGVQAHTVDSPVELAALDSLDAVILALAGEAAANCTRPDWQRILDEHNGVVRHIHTDAKWTRAVADKARTSGHPVRMITVTEALTALGRSRAQAAAQLARAGAKATDGLVLAFAISAESEDFPIGFVEHLVCSAAASELVGAELVSGAGWFGVRSHPQPTGSISFGGPAVPGWFDQTLQEVVSPQ